MTQCRNVKSDKRVYQVCQQEIVWIFGSFVHLSLPFPPKTALYSEYGVPILLPWCPGLNTRLHHNKTHTFKPLWPERRCLSLCHTCTHPPSWTGAHDRPQRRHWIILHQLQRSKQMCRAIRKPCTEAYNFWQEVDRGHDHKPTDRRDGATL